MKHYEVVEVPYGWRVVEHHTKGIKFHTKLFHTRADALRRADALAATQMHLTAVATVRRRSLDRCECLGECGHDHQPDIRCRWRHGEVISGMAGAVVLVVVPLDHNPDNLEPANLRSYCQLCRLYHEADERNTDPLFEIG